MWHGRRASWECDELEDALYQRLDDDEAYADTDQRSVSETVERLCRDLQLKPDWTRWTGQD